MPKVKGSTVSVLMISINELSEFQISEEEISFLTQGEDPYDDAVVRKLFHPNLKLLLVTEGPQGCRYYTQASSLNMFLWHFFSLLHVSYLDVWSHQNSDGWSRHFRWGMTMGWREAVFACPRPDLMPWQWVHEPEPNHQDQVVIFQIHPCPERKKSCICLKYILFFIF